MSDKTPPKNRRARSDSLTPSTGAESEPPYSPKRTGVIPPPTSPSQPPSNTASPSSIPSTGYPPTRKRCAQDSREDTVVFNGPENKPQITDSTTATSDPKLEIKAVLAAVPEGPTSGSYRSKPLEPGYATAGLDLTKPSKEQGSTTTKDFKMQTDEAVAGGVNAKGGKGMDVSTAEKLEHQLSETEALEEEIKRATEAFVSDKDDETVVETGKKTG